MKRHFIIIILILFVSLTVFPDIRELVVEIDQLHEAYRHQEIPALIEGSLSKATTAKEKAEIYWRLARALLYNGDIAEDSGQKKEEILAIFSRAEEAGEQAIQFDASNPNGYYWKSSAMGRWGQVKGIFDSLAKAKPMQELLIKAINTDTEFSKAFQVLGMLYEALPGWPISFGNADYAVSLARKAVDLHEKEVAAGKKSIIDYTFYKELAAELYKRNWSADTRAKEQKKKASKYNTPRDILEKNFYFEAMVNIPDQSDREEAFALVRMSIAALENKADRTKYEEKDLMKLKELLKKWGG